MTKMKSIRYPITIMLCSWWVIKFITIVITLCTRTSYTATSTTTPLCGKVRELLELYKQYYMIDLILKSVNLHSQ